MKILYIAHERRAAQLAARALRDVAPNGTLTWASTLAAARRWVEHNREAAAVILEADVHREGCSSFVDHVRGLGLTTAIVIVAAEPAGAPLDDLKTRGDVCIVDSRALQADLPRILAGALERTRAGASTAHKSDAVTRASIDREGTSGEVLEATSRTEIEERVVQEVAKRTEQHNASLARAARLCAALQQRLGELEAALRNADERRASEAAASADQLAQRHAEFTASLAQAAQRREELAQKLSAAMAALDDARQARTAEAAAAAQHLARREAELRGALAAAEAARIAVEKTLAETKAAHQHARQRAAADLAAAGAREAALEVLLTREAATRRSLEENLALAEAARREADHHHATEVAAATRRLDDVQARYDAASTEYAAARCAFEQQVADAAAALDEAGHARAAEAAAAAEHLARREGELGGALLEAEAARTAIEETLARAKAAHQHAQQSAEAGLTAAAGREADLLERLNQESAMRAALDGQLAESRTTSAQARRRLLESASALRRRTREQTARLEAQLEHERAESEQTLESRNTEIGELRQELEKHRQSIAASQEQLAHLHQTLDDERQDHERARLTSESELQRMAVEYDQLRQSLDRVQAAFHTLEHVAGEHASERARLESVVADRDAQLTAQSERHLDLQQAAEDAAMQVQERHRLAVEASGRDIARLQGEINGLRQELQATRRHAEALRRDADRVPVLQMELEASQKENRRQFERAPYGLCHCTPDGVVTHVNHSLARLLGYRRADDLRPVDFTEAVFECAADLRWLIERSLSTGTTESVETTWKTREGRRLVVRLHALTTTSESVGIAVEDITDLRAVEQRLRRAQRMEAVGRLASEVAVTCDTLLRDVTQDGQQWLAAIDSDTVLRRKGELLLGEVTRAAGFLRQFGVYGNNQLSALEPVGVQRVLRDLEPVLKRVAGDDIELVLPKTSAPFDVEVEAERVERILVNVASYARERMPHGGRVKIDLATTVVDRRFVARYPDVRPGAHVLITVNEVQGIVRAALPGEPREEAGVNDKPSGPDRPGVDLGVLLGLIGDCGGHLWMEAERSGNMTLKIRLPKRVPDDVADSAVPPARADRGRRSARWFRTDRRAASRPRAPVP